MKKTMLLTAVSECSYKEKMKKKHTKYHNKNCFTSLLNSDFQQIKKMLNNFLEVTKKIYCNFSKIT